MSTDRPLAAVVVPDIFELGLYRLVQAVARWWKMCSNRAVLVRSVVLE